MKHTYTPSTHAWTLLSLTVICILAALLATTTTVSADTDGPKDTFSFYITSDIQGYAGWGEYETCENFRGVLESIDALGSGAFMVSPGDLAPLEDTYWTITSTLGADYPWYPVMGNHEFPDAESEAVLGENLAWLRAYNFEVSPLGPEPALARTGPAGCPETTYSFDYGQAHFVALNVYCDAGGDTAAEGDITDHLYTWLAEDLADNDKPLIFVFGHEPAYPQPDAETNRIRHLWDSLNAYPEHRDRFWQLLKRQGVTAYINGHTQGYSAVRIDGVWQIDDAHARGTSDQSARSTFIRINVAGTDVRYETYRQTPDDACAYELTDAWDTQATTRDIPTPTPVLTATPAPRSLVGGAETGGIVATVGLGLLTLALTGGSIAVLVIAVRADKR